MQADIEIRPRLRGRASAAERIFAALITRLKAGCLIVVLPDGSERVFEGSEPGPQAELHVRRPRLFRRILLGGDVGFAEAYIDGDCEVPDLTALIELAVLNETVLYTVLGGQPWAGFLRRVNHLLRPNSRRGARRNISRHYDLGNAFYSAWLDPTMTYSAGVYERAGDGLQAAQINKYRRMARLAGLASDHKVLEIGCGWGGFASWAAREIGCRLTALTLSRAQHDYAAKRLFEAGLADRVDLRLLDYRDLRGQFDRIVSIEMIEAVGERYWPVYFEVLRERLRPGGRAALQSITIDARHFESYRRDADFIQRYIFPGGMLPSPGALRREAGQAGLAWLGSDGFGDHYARTLVAWRRNFEACCPDLAGQGFDERFRRTWRYYLAYCEAGFRAERIDVLQFLLARA